MNSTLLLFLQTLEAQYFVRISHWPLIRILASLGVSLSESADLTMLFSLAHGKFISIAFDSLNFFSTFQMKDHLATCRNLAISSSLVKAVLTVESFEIKSIGYYISNINYNNTGVAEYLTHPVKLF